MLGRPARCESAEAAKGGQHDIIRIASVTTAGIRQEINGYVCEPLLRRPEAHDGVLLEHHPIDRDTEKSYEVRVKPPDQPLDASEAPSILFRCQSIDAGARPINEIGDP